MLRRLCSDLLGTRIGVTSSRLYGTNPIEYRTKEELVASATGGAGARGTKMSKKKINRSRLRRFRFVQFGVGKKDERWAGLSYPLKYTPLNDATSNWLTKKDKLGMFKKHEIKGDLKHVDNTVDFRILEGDTKTNWPLSERYWATRGWTSSNMNGAYVGCPEMPDGRCMTDFQSYVIELKRVAIMKRGGRKKTVSCLVVVGNRNGAVGFAVGKGQTNKTAIRKAKNKALHHLQYIPRYDNHTVFHNLKVKYVRTNVMVERNVKGSGLCCHRIIMLICRLAGITDLYAKIVGSTNPLNIIRATMKALTSQQTHQELADKSQKFVVEFRRECDYRPIVVAVPKSLNTPEITAKLQAMKVM